MSSCLRTLLGLEALMAGNVRPVPAGGHFCLICTKVIKGNYTTAKYHFRDLHWSEAPTYTCPAPQCQKVNTSQAAFKMHRNVGTILTGGKGGVIPIFSGAGT